MNQSERQHVPVLGRALSKRDRRAVMRRAAGGGVRVEALEQRRLLAIPAGGEFRVSTFADGDQDFAATAMDASGDFVITWVSDGQDGSSWGVYAQRYNSAGVPQGSEFRVNTYTIGDQSSPCVAMDADGDFVISWSSGGQDGDGSGVYAQRYNSGGVAQGGEFQINTNETGNQGYPSAGMDAEGNFVITWDNSDGSSSQVDAQRYNSAGVPQGGEFRVNIDSDAYGPAMATDPAGNFVIAWVFSDDYTSTATQDGGVIARRYNSAGVPQGGEFRVDTSRSSGHSVAMDASGDFVIASANLSLYQGNPSGGYAQRYNSAGVAQGTQIRVTNFTGPPSTAMNADGDFVTAWAGDGQDGNSSGVYAHRYISAGAAQGGEFLVNAYTTGGQRDPSVAMDADGDFIIVWSSDSQDGSGSGIYAQRFLKHDDPFAGLAAGTLTIRGTSGNDVISVALQGPTLVVTRNGEELNFANADVARIEVYALDGNDTVTLGEGFVGAYVLGGSGDDLLFGGSGRDSIYGGDGNDTIFGGNHNDTIYGDAGNDSIDGQNHNDRLYPGSGMDTAKGGNGDDQTYAYDGEEDNVNGGNGYDGVDWDLFDIFTDTIEALEDWRLLAFPQGGEFRVNTFTGGNQDFVAAAMDADGDFVITWDSHGQDGSYAGVFAQRYNAAGVPQGSEFQVDTPALGGQGGPSVAMDADGDFAIAWHGVGQDGGNGVYVQRYNSAGVLQGGEFRVNTYTTNVQSGLAMAMDANGDFVITWVEVHFDHELIYGVYARRYNFAGVPQGGEFRVNTTAADYATRPSAAMDNDGDFVIAWDDGLSGYDVHAQRYNSGGVAQGGELRVTTLAGFQTDPSVAMDADGDFVISWLHENRFIRPDDADSYGVYAQRYNSAGIAQGDQVRVTTFTGQPSVAMDSDGNFVIAWGGYGEVYAQRYNSAGVAEREEFRVNTYTAGYQGNPSAAMDADGDFVVAWSGPGQDGIDSYGVYAQRFGSPSFGTLSDGLLTITGTVDNDIITVALQGTTLVVTRNGEELSFPSTDVTSIKVYGNDGNDRVTIGARIIGAYVLGGNGSDTLIGGDGDDSLAGASGKDRLEGGGGTNRLAGGKHNDLLVGGEGDERFYGDEANDTIQCSAGRDRAYGGDGDDRILGGNQNDTMYGEAGNDTLDGQNHNDRLYGGEGNDRLIGYVGNDLLSGEDGFDTLIGNDGADTAIAGGNDLIRSIETLA